MFPRSLLRLRLTVLLASGRVENLAELAKNTAAEEGRGQVGALDGSATAGLVLMDITAAVHLEDISVVTGGKDQARHTGSRPKPW